MLAVDWGGVGVGLSMYGDPDALDRLAHRLQAQATEVREEAADHVRRGEAARWVSAAAQAYRDRVAQDRADAERAAAEMDRAAAVLRAHAAEVREMIALIARYEQAASAWFEQQARSLTNTVDDAVDAAGRVVKRLVNDPPWLGWPVGPGTLPPPGDMKWLDVGGFMRKQGVL